VLVSRCLPAEIQAAAAAASDGKPAGEPTAR